MKARDIFKVKGNNLRDFLGFHELKTWEFTQCMIAEFMGTFMIVVGGCGSVVLMNQGGPVPPISAAAVFGMTVTVMHWSVNHRGGAHYNPSVTMGFFVTGVISLTRCIGFILIQCLGAVSGAGLLYFLVPAAWRGTLASTVLHPEISVGQGFVIEMLCAFILVLLINSCCDRLREDHNGSLALHIGLAVFTQAAWAGPATGCGMNPARSLGPALVTGTWDDHWLYWVAPILGGMLAALFYHHIMAIKPPITSISLEYDYPPENSPVRNENSPVRNENIPERNATETRTYPPQKGCVPLEGIIKFIAENGLKPECVTFDTTNDMQPEEFITFDTPYDLKSELIAYDTPKNGNVAMNNMATSNQSRDNLSLDNQLKKRRVNPYSVVNIHTVGDDNQEKGDDEGRSGDVIQNPTWPQNVPGHNAPENGESRSLENLEGRTTQSQSEIDSDGHVQEFQNPAFEDDINISKL